MTCVRATAGRLSVHHLSKSNPRLSGTDPAQAAAMPRHVLLLGDLVGRMTWAASSPSTALTRQVRPVRARARRLTARRQSVSGGRYCQRSGTLSPSNLSAR
jgi:hypothetical protein